MQFFQRIPKLLRWLFSVTIILLLIMTLFRFLFYVRYNPSGKAFSGSAFLLGLRYDARVVSIIGAIILILCIIPCINPFKNFKSKAFWNLLLPLLFTVILFFYVVDYYHFDYLHQRLNASILNYLEDAGISYAMIWQTYPLIKIVFVFIFLWILARWGFTKLLAYYQRKDTFIKRKGIAYYIIIFLMFAIFIFGKAGQFPLRWSDAYTLSDDFKANLALNPFQSFFSTLSFRNSTYDIKKVKEYYPVIADYLEVQQPDSAKLNFKRNYSAIDTFINKPNIVLVICESFSAYKSSMYGNPLNTTPYFNEMCKKGIFFDRCFTPSYGTARGVWATITGIPDVEFPRTASRNPNAVNQQTIINSFDNYSKLYFLGGSATWANIRGLLINNINKLNLYEQEDYTSPKIDVWGISDKNLFIEANQVLKQQSKPFFAIIQTADNHRPYTIPEEDKNEFIIVSLPEDSLKRYGFENNNEMNAFRYTDFCYQKFIEAAKKETYFNNTIFVFVGDHGIRGDAGNILPKSFTQQGLTAEHVPLLFYSPELLNPKRIHEVCSQIDILPSIASLAKISYQNYTLGRNLFDTTSTHQNKHAFIFDPDIKTIGMISNEYYYVKSMATGKREFVSINNNEHVPANSQTDSVKNYLDKLTNAYYETAWYLLLNNKKD